MWCTGSFNSLMVLLSFELEVISNKSSSLVGEICELHIVLQYVYWNQGLPDNENQSEGRTETIDSNIFKSSQSNAQYKTMKSRLVRWPVMFTRLRRQLNVKLKTVELSCAYGFRNNFMLHPVYFRSMVYLENKRRVPLVIILPECRELNHCVVAMV